MIVDPKPGNVYDRLSGDSQSFTCHTTGSHSALSFYHNGVKLKYGVNGIKIIGSTLTINHTSTEHTGMYQCITENERGSDGFSWFLLVRDPSELSTALCLNIVVLRNYSMSSLLRPNFNQITGHLHCILLANVRQMSLACCMGVDTEGVEVYSPWFLTPTVCTPIHKSWHMAAMLCMIP